MVDDIVYDAIIVGGGPGGSTCAAFLVRKGRKVLLLEKEKYPRDKTCGDAISGKSMGVLAELGLVQNVAKADHSVVNGVIFSSPNGKSVKIMLNERKGGMEGSYVCRRMVYDNILFQNAANAVTAVDGATVTSLLRSGEDGKGAVCGVKANVGGKEMMYKSKIVIGADGNGSVAARAVAGHEVDPDHTCIAYRGYYSGIVGMENCLEIHFVKS
ncbi:MAG: FAD-dependent monooxygenase, partial [Candidatus Micrarchaeota archaeon]|nr:FAD-dependent monooxygenase [Candidatus Micrarchaeota archaeon]